MKHLLAGGAPIALAIARINELGEFQSPNICFATESPLIHDGGQTTAQTDMSQAATLSGNNGSGQFLAVKITASRGVYLANSGGEAIYGILQNQPKAGEAADVGILGISMAVLGSTVAAAAYLMTDTNGRLITATSTNHRVAQALEAGVAGDIIAVALGPNSADTVA